MDSFSRSCAHFARLFFFTSVLACMALLQGAQTEPFIIYLFLYYLHKRPVECRCRKTTNDHPNRRAIARSWLGSGFNAKGNKEYGCLFNESSTKKWRERKLLRVQKRLLHPRVAKVLLLALLSFSLSFLLFLSFLFSSFLIPSTNKQTKNSLKQNIYKHASKHTPKRAPKQ